MYLDEIEAGFRFTTPSHEMTEAQILEYAHVYDPQPFHIDREAAKASIYGGLIASGLQTCAICFRLTLAANIFNEASLGSPGMDRLRWLKPVRPGDVLTVEGRVTAVARSASRPDRGRIEVDYVGRNQNGEDVISYSITHMLKCRP
ncbi:MaoC family dehydratase [Pseudooceanicola sp. C21-150M6]|uniref:MaoC family dehydratase n=1 Tax=Pseudooceanicola sp. C21-150M6 TaxID=3434355 RepID=UPI003D7FCD8A